MTLIFKVDPDTVQIHLHTKFCGPRSNGSPVEVIEALCVGVLGVGVLKQRNKERKKLCENLKAVLYTGII